MPLSNTCSDKKVERKVLKEGRKEGRREGGKENFEYKTISVGFKWAELGAK